MEYIRQIKAFGTFSQVFKKNSQEKVRLDSSLFKLHSQVTVLILMVGTMFVSMRQYFGEPIECLAHRSDIPPAMLQHYCWLEATFSVSEPDGRAVVGPQVAYPGVKPLNTETGERQVFHKYYQWVYFVLIIQSILFYIPKFLWRAKEGKRLRILIEDLSNQNIKNMKDHEANRLLQDLMDSILISQDYFFFFFVCELLCYIHLIIEIWFVHIFLSGQFLSLGLHWLYYSHDDQPAQYDPLIRVFPRMTKCLFHKFGNSGSIEKHDALCFLPLNIVNEKLYVVLWFWFAFLLSFTSVALLQRMALVVCPNLRYRQLLTMAPSTRPRYLEQLSSRVGYWFILNALANNLKPSYFSNLVDALIREHFDKEGKPILSKPAATSGLDTADDRMLLSKKKNTVSAPSAPSVGSMMKPKKSSNKSSAMKGMGRAPAKTSFVTVNRDPPSGHSADSDDWPMNLGKV